MVRSSPPTRAVLGTTVALLTSCTTTEMAQSWRDSTYTPAPVQHVLVVAITPRESYRVAFEDAVAKAFVERGFPTVTAVSLFPEGRPTRDQVAAYVKSQGVDLVVTQRVAKQLEITHAPGAPYEPVNANNDWYGPWDASAPMAAGPDEYSENVTMAAETSVYAVKTQPERAIWRGSSTTFDFRSVRGAAASLAASLANNLVKTGILRK